MVRPETLRVAYHADDGTGDAQKVVKRVFFFPIGNYTHPAKIVAMAEQGDGPGPLYSNATKCSLYRQVSL
jgi:hypothetical protein